MKGKSTKAMIERMELVNGLNRELNRKVSAYRNILDSLGKYYTWPSDTSKEKCSPMSIKRTITLMREQLLLLEQEVRGV